MSDILDLPEWEVMESERQNGEYIIIAKHLPQPAACMKCGVIGRLYRHGTRTIRHLDSPIRGLGSFELEEMTLRGSTLLCKRCADRAI